MIRNTIVTIAATLVIIAVNLNADVVHWPLFVILLSALVIGYLEPKKGWISAIQLIVGIFAGFYLAQFLGIEAKFPNINQFSTYISPLPCLFGGFMGSFFSKTLHQK
ncbi:MULTISPECIES: hypothetical protein [Arcicella]|uniref:Uncharacterized protein n=1 Tax=Arcicella aquatica TaxID=217141 RepID=A0ABU5QMI3_9BACT|nr:MULTISPECIES: hypothetical protein [Arcicella]MDR6560146.1 ABC-type multidrug transport system permease subunit [Arcicella sp. BE51]MDR6810247.1 ABC-type multidrug transport system permease subunit [Arcicella sp. BE140]MDR6821597.1 ABC-type multidrug transport system permease subunit [Arcicella sp. BE139]MEA5258262.1 hypothetical protein [Arcicella aquatica]